jgi:hypothetical protein
LSDVLLDRLQRRKALGHLLLLGSELLLLGSEPLCAAPHDGEIERHGLKLLRQLRRSHRCGGQRLTFGLGVRDG